MPCGTLLNNLKSWCFKFRRASTLDNALAKPGENLGVNFFAVTPYYLDEDL